VYTVSRHEKRVAQNLNARQVSCFLPLYRSLRRWRDRRKEVELPLFPGYLFVHIARQDQIHVLKVPSVVGLVGCNGQPIPIQELEIEALRRSLTPEVRVEPCPYLTAGRRVRVRYGPLVGCEGILVRRKETLRVVLSVTLLMRSLSVEVDVSDVEPVR
jgi:transcription antitermination factor NusG